MSLQQIYWIRHKPYFLHKISNTKPDMRALKKAVPKADVYWVRIYNTRTHKDAYAIYLTKKVGYY